MSLPIETVQHVAKLARLRITGEEAEVYAQQLSRILGLMAQLDRLPTDDVAPMSHAVAVALPERPDRVTGVDQREALLACAPESEEGCFRVPKILE
ncbi:MAG: Asp-tRNA(Asn)/Glu-tRNA(Gln) amidotransferase subunit GatC [Magnetococcales bacterium]|nr:Asp-tRNA(Asn)/Glu-tRNA(Gln) amidotransferase subunit GatC [Magnetococcales bacterium]